MGRILIIKLSALGDLVQADGAIRDIREHHPEARITVLTRPSFRQFMERCPWVDEVLSDPRAVRYNLVQMLRLRNCFRKGGYTRVYDLQQVGRTRFYYRWLFPRTEWLGDVGGATFYLKRPDTSSAADHFANHLRIAGIKVKHTLNNDLSWMADDVSTILSVESLEPGYVVLIPGASASHGIKRWPYYGELASRLLESGRQVVTIPGPDEMALCRTIPGKMLVPEDGYYDFFALAGIVKKSGFVIGNDTGPTHIAAHVGARGLALYSGHTRPEATGIQHSQFHTMESEDLADLDIDSVWNKVLCELQRKDCFHLV